MGVKMSVTKESKSKDESINVDAALAALKKVETKTASNQKLESAVKRVRRDLTLYKGGGDLNLYEIPNFIRDVETIVNSSNLSSEEKEMFAAQMDGFQDFLEDRGIVVEKEPEKKNVVKPHHSSTFKKAVGTALLGAALFNFTGLTPKAEAQSVQTAQTTQTQTDKTETSAQKAMQNYLDNNPQMQNIVKAQNEQIHELQEANANQIKAVSQSMKQTIHLWQKSGVSKKEIRTRMQNMFSELKDLEKQQDAYMSGIIDQQMQLRTVVAKGLLVYYNPSNQQQNNNYQNQNASQQQLSPQEQQAQYMKSQEDMQEKQMEMEMQMQKQQAEEQMKIYHQQMVDSTISNLAVYGGMMGLARAFY